MNNKYIKSNELISIITPTYNSGSVLPNLIASLYGQTDSDFEWVVVDGASTDNTLALLNSVIDIEVKIISERDFGIYDALNKGIVVSNGDYYVVVGSDDCLNPDAIKLFKEIVKSHNFLPDIVAASVIIDSRIVAPRAELGWLYGIMGVASSHSVGTLIKKALHCDIGWYSRKFPIAADQLFIKTAINSGARVVRGDFVAGTFSTLGVSANDHLGMLTEFFRTQMLTEKFKSIQVVLFIIRLLKNIRKIIKQYSNVEK